MVCPLYNLAAVFNCGKTELVVVAVQGPPQVTRFTHRRWDQGHVASISAPCISPLASLSGQADERFTSRPTVTRILLRTESAPTSQNLKYA